MEDLISVIIPIYRVESYLEKCIYSVRNQTYKNLEIILVYRESNDQCPQICKKHAYEDKRIKIIRQETKGLDAARKEGMLAAHGKYIGYVDGDDWIEPIMYEELINFAYQHNVDIVESGVIDTWSNVEKKREPYLPEGCYMDKDFVENVEPKLLYAGEFFEHGITPYMWTKLFLKETIMAYQMLGGMSNVVCDDIMVSLPCIAKSKKLYISHNCYYHYRVRSDSLKRKFKQEEGSNIIECYPDFFRRFRGSLLCKRNNRQIETFTIYWLLYRAPQVFDNLDERFFLTPFGSIEINKKIVLYGAGAVGIQLERYVRNIEGSNLVCWVDKNYKNLQDTLGVRNPSEISCYEYDYIIISVMRGSAVKSVKKDLLNLGVPREKIRWIEQKYIDNPELLLNKVIKGSVLNKVDG